METFIESKKQPQTYISDYAVLIKKMRLIRKLNRKQAALLLPFSHKNIEKLENGRGTISIEQFKLFQSVYHFTDSEIEDIRSNKFKTSRKIKTEKRKGRRFCHKIIGRECKVLKELRLTRGFDQYTASKECKFGKRVIGFIENGRITLNEKKIRHMVETYGFTMEYFYQLLKKPLLRHEIIEQCQILLEKMDENKLRIIMPMLQSM